MAVHKKHSIPFLAPSFYVRCSKDLPRVFQVHAGKVLSAPVLHPLGQEVPGIGGP